MDERIDFARLPSPRPPESLWSAIAGELDWRRRRRHTARFSALAAMLAVIVVASVVVEMPAPPNGTSGETARPAQMGLAELRATSARLESRLADRRRGVVDSMELESLLWLEAELSWLDEQLTDAPADPELWRQRILLLSELNRRYAEGDWRHEMLLAGI